MFNLLKQKRKEYFANIEQGRFLHCLAFSFYERGTIIPEVHVPFGTITFDDSTYIYSKLHFSERLPSEVRSIAYNKAIHSGEFANLTNDG